MNVVPGSVGAHNTLDIEKRSLEYIQISYSEKCVGKETNTNIRDRPTGKQEEIH